MDNQIPNISRDESDPDMKIIRNGEVVYDGEPVTKAKKKKSPMWRMSRRMKTQKENENGKG